ncbi:MAG: hypothetical protein HC922_09955 [Leptolyngbyaceae cyanobacterium SM2_3_12]|nr:hypothetical protein [Leptolyngbyaceae cyanobacterium SM2_3_12]
MIVRNVLLILLLSASSVVLAAEIHASAAQQDVKTVALRRLFAYQMIMKLDQE